MPGAQGEASLRARVLLAALEGEARGSTDWADGGAVTLRQATCMAAGLKGGPADGCCALVGRAGTADRTLGTSGWVPLAVLAAVLAVILPAIIFLCFGGGKEPDAARETPTRRAENGQPSNAANCAPSSGTVVGSSKPGQPANPVNGPPRSDVGKSPKGGPQGAQYESDEEANHASPEDRLNHVAYSVKSQVRPPLLPQPSTRHKPAA
jgi:hypothetical protein